MKSKGGMGQKGVKAIKMHGYAKAQFLFLSKEGRDTERAKKGLKGKARAD